MQAPATRPASRPQRVVTYRTRRYRVPWNTEILEAIDVDPNLTLTALRRRIGNRPLRSREWADAASLRMFARGDDGLWHPLGSRITVPMGVVSQLEVLVDAFQLAAAECR